MWEPPFFGGFQGLWEGWETGQSYRPVSQAFHQAVISTAVRERVFSMKFGP